MKKLEKQVCNIAYSKEICKHSINLKPCYYWVQKEESSKPILVNYKSKLVSQNDLVYPAFTVAELGELLLSRVADYSVYIFPVEFNLFNGRDDHGTAEAFSEADLRAKMLIRALEIAASRRKAV